MLYELLRKILGFFSRTAGRGKRGRDEDEFEEEEWDEDDEYEASLH